MDFFLGTGSLTYLHNPHIYNSTSTSRFANTIHDEYPTLIPSKLLRSWLKLFFHVKAWVLLVLIGFYSWILTLNSLAYIFCWFLLSVTKLITPVFLIKPILSCYWIFSPSRTMPSGELTWREGLWKHCTRHATLTTKDTVYGAGLLTSFGLEMMLSQNLILTIQKPFCILGTWWNLLITISMFLLAGNICFTLISTNNFKFFPTSIYI